MVCSDAVFSPRLVELSRFDSKSIIVYFAGDSIRYSVELILLLISTLHVINSNMQCK